MLAMSFISQFMPQENRFFRMLDAIAHNVAESSDAFAILRDAHTPEEFLKVSIMLRDLEHKGDKMAHEFYNALDQTFVTPLDREDLHDLCSALDTIVDLMEECAGFIVNYRLKDLTPPMRELIRIAQTACHEVETTISLLADSKRYPEMNDHLIRVHALENEGDTVYRLAVGELFQTQTNAIELIREKDIIEALECAIDAADDACNLVRSLSMKNA